MSKPDWIDPFIRSGHKLVANHDPSSHLPFNAWRLHPLYNDLFLKKIYQLVTTFEEKGYKISDHLDSFSNLSSTRFIVFMNMVHYQTSGMDDPKLLTTIQDFFVESIKLRAKEDLFAEKKNVQYSDDEINKLISSNNLQEASIDESREIGKILVALGSITHGLYNDWCTDYDYEISGPYYVDDEMILLRSFPDLFPKDIWPEIDWDFREASILTCYKNLDASVGFVGCHIVYNGNAVENLVRYGFVLDGKDISGLQDLKNFRDKVMAIAASQYEKFMAMPWEEQKIKYVWQEHYQFKKLFDLVGLDWRPSPEIIERIKGKALLEDVFPNYNLSIEEFSRVFGADKMIEAYNKLEV